MHTLPSSLQHCQRSSMNHNLVTMHANVVIDAVFFTFFSTVYIEYFGELLSLMGSASWKPQPAGSLEVTVFITYYRLFYDLISAADRTIRVMNFVIRLFPWVHSTSVFEVRVRPFFDCAMITQQQRPHNTSADVLESNSKVTCRRMNVMFVKRSFMQSFR